MKKDAMIKAVIVFMAVTCISGYLTGASLTEYANGAKMADDLQYEQAELGTENIVVADEINVFGVAADGEMQNTDGDKVIAPGEDGSFEISLSGTAPAKVKLDFVISDGLEESKKPQEIQLPLVYSIEVDGKTEYYSDFFASFKNCDGNEWLLKLPDTDSTEKVEISGTLKDLSDRLSSVVERGESYKNYSPTIEWFWPYEWECCSGSTGSELQSDKSDTFMARLASEGINIITELNVAVSAEQIG